MRSRHRPVTLARRRTETLRKRQHFLDRLIETQATDPRADLWKREASAVKWAVQLAEAEVERLRGDT